MAAISKYDSADRMVEATAFDEDGHVTKRMTYKYDASGKRKEDVTYDAAGKIKSTERFQYDPKGRVAKRI